MPTGSGSQGSGGDASGSTSSNASHLPWNLIPSFDPGETDLSDYARRLSFLAGVWPKEHLDLLAPRAALQCKGSAFQKVVRLDATKLKVKSDAGIKLLVQTLGGVWGKTTLEDKYERFEKAIYGISQKGDESNESYMARHEVVFEDMITQGASMEDMRAYILLRNSNMNSEDKKRVIVEAAGNLTYDAVTKAIRMLGSRFFQELQGQTKGVKNKTYEINMTQDQEEEIYAGEETFPWLENSDLAEIAMDQLLTEGDEDALTVQQFEDALLDTLQNDNEMSVFMTTYADARRRLADKAKSRGFWPVKGGKSGGKSKGKGKTYPPRQRKPLAQRIAESECRYCGNRGHWRAECPKRIADAARNQNQTKTANTLTVDEWDDDADIYLDESEEAHTVIATRSCTDPPMHPSSHVQDIFALSHMGHPKSHSQGYPLRDGHRVTPKAHHNREFYHAMKDRLHRVIHSMHRQPIARTMPSSDVPETPSCNETEVRAGPCDRRMDERPSTCHASLETPMENTVMFATSQSIGIVDLGASQTVMGKHQEEEFLDNLPAETRQRVQYKDVHMSFRFGNNSVVSCSRAMLVPIHKYWVKIAIVDTKTPFLISNSVCRTLGAVIDTAAQTIHFQQLGCTLPLTLSSKKLFLLDFCDLINHSSSKTTQKRSSRPEEGVICHEQANSVSAPAAATPMKSNTVLIGPNHAHSHSTEHDHHSSFGKSCSPAIVSQQPRPHSEIIQFASETVTREHHVPVEASHPCRALQECDQNKETQEQVTDLWAMSFEELSNLTITFGEAKVGQKFSKVIQEDPKYCQWFLTRWGQSPKLEHQKFTYFLNMWIEQQEANMNDALKPSAPSLSESGKSYPKAKAKSLAKPSNIDDFSDWEDMDKSWPDPVALEEVNATVLNDNTQRIEKLESVMNQILVHIQQLTTNPPMRAGETPP